MRAFACVTVAVPASWLKTSTVSRRSKGRLWQASGRSIASLRPQRRRLQQGRTVTRTRWQTPPAVLHRRSRMPGPRSSDDPCHRSCQSRAGTTARQLPATTLALVRLKRSPDRPVERPASWECLFGLATWLSCSCGLVTWLTASKWPEEVSSLHPGGDLGGRPSKRGVPTRGQLSSYRLAEWLRHTLE